MDWTVIGAFALGGVFVYLSVIYCWNKLLGQNIDFKDYRIYLALFILTLVGSFLNYAGPPYLKLPLIILLLFVTYYFVISNNLKYCITSVILVQGIAMVSELIVALVASIFVGDYANLFMKEPIGIIILNMAIAFLLVLFIQCKFIKIIYMKLVDLFQTIKQNNLVLCCLATIILSIVFMMMSYMPLPKSIVLLINSTLVILYVVMICWLISVQGKFNKINGKYETSLSSLKEYEDIMDKYKVDNHENKNQLLTIRNMIKAKDKTTIKYIDKLVDNKIKDNENIFYKTSKIPEGGLRATIYSKLCRMKDAEIEYNLEIANDIRTVDLLQMGDDTMLNICKIIGVFLDNAIEAVENLDEKDIIVEIYIMDNNLCIEISNNYKEEIAIDKISNKGYTTKGKGHGYGLSLVSKLIESDFNLEHEKEISKDLFTQRLKIKM